MPKIKLPRSNPKLDMTPMVDLAFLLVTFFMLTTQFRADEPVVVDPPSAEAVKTFKDSTNGVISFSISPDGRVFFNMNNKNDRLTFIRNLNDDRKLNLTDEEMQLFAKMSSFGVPFNQLKSFLGPNHEELTQKQPGIPTDTVASSPKNELDYWVRFSRQAAPAAFIAVRGDRNAQFGAFNGVVKTLVRNRANRFNLITNMQTESNQ